MILPEYTKAKRKSFKARASAVILGIVASIAAVLLLVLLFRPIQPLPVIPKKFTQTTATNQPTQPLTLNETPPSQPEPELQSSTTAKSTQSTESTPSLNFSKFQGQVVSEDPATQLEGVTIELQTGEFPIPYMNMGRNFITVAEATTDSTGAFVLEIPEGALSVKDNMVRILAKKANYATIGAMLARKSSQSLEEEFPAFQLPLLPAGEVSGKVVNRFEEGIPNANVGFSFFPIGDEQVRIKWRTQEYVGDRPTINYFVMAQTVSQQSGSFVLEGIPDNWKDFIPAKAEGFSLGVTEEVAKRGDQNLKIVLTEASASLNGTISFKSGTPIENAQIRIFPSNNNVMKFLFEFPVETTSDAEGKFSLSQLEPGQQTILASQSNYLFNSKFHYHQIVLNPQETTEVTIIIPDPLIITGKVTNSQTGEPLSGIIISDELTDIFDPFQPLSSLNSVRTNTEGNYTITCQPWMNYLQLFAQTPEGYLPDPNNTYRTEYIELDENPEGTITHDIKFQPAVLREGIVYLADGTTPAVKAQVSLIIQAGNGNIPLAETNAEGRYTLNGELGKNYAVRALHETGWGILPEMTSDQLPEPIVLQPYGEISGTITFPETITPMVLNLNCYNSSQIPFQFDLFSSSISNLDGTFNIPKLTPGIYRIEANSEQSGGALISASVENIEVITGQITQNVVINIEEGDLIVGTVVDNEGKPIKDAQIQYSKGISNGYLITDAEGIFEIHTNTADASLQYLSVRKVGYNEVYKNNVTAYDSPLVIELTPLGEFEIQAVDEISKKPIPNYSYIVYNDAWLNSPMGELIQVNSKDGKAEVKNLPNRTLKINVMEQTASGNATGRKGTVRFTTTEAKSPLLIPVGEPYSASGVVHDSLGKPLPGAEVMLILQNQRNLLQDYTIDSWKTYDTTLQIAPVKTNAKGEFQLEGLPMGTYGLMAFKDDEASPPIDLDVPNRNVTGLVLAFTGKGSIKGTVTGLDGKPATEANIVYNKNSGSNNSMMIRIMVNKDGEYKIENLDPGKLFISANIESNQMNDSTLVDVIAGEETVANFDFSKYIEISGSIRENGSSIFNNQAFFNIKSVLFKEDFGSPLDSYSRSNYKKYVKPGVYHVTKNSTNSYIQFIVQEINVLSEPEKQTFDIDYSTAKGFVVLELENENIELQGSITFEQRLPSGSYSTQPLYTTNKSNLFESMPVGDYQVSYISQNKLESGSSPWTTISPGGENIIVVLIEENSNEDSLIGRLQKALKSLGYDPGPIDGLWGSMTSAALLKYQQDKGLEQTGEINEESKTALGL